MTFSNRDAAMRCFRHFHGQMWRGIVTTARLLPNTATLAAPKQMSADAPDFVPMSGLSADAPEFVPMPGLLDVYLPSKVDPAVASDVSTEDGESETEDDAGKEVEN